jgi:hypothetical protein
MPSTTSARTRRNGRLLKSPLAVASSRICPGAPAAGPEETYPVPAIALSERKATIAEYEDYLRTTTNRDDRPYEEATINAYVSPARHLEGGRTGRSPCPCPRHHYPSKAAGPTWRSRSLCSPRTGPCRRGRRPG